MAPLRSRITEYPGSWFAMQNVASSRVWLWDQSSVVMVWLWLWWWDSVRATTRIAHRLYCACSTLAWQMLFRIPLWILRIELIGDSYTANALCSSSTGRVYKTIMILVICIYLCISDVLYTRPCLLDMSSWQCSCPPVQSHLKLGQTDSCN